MPGCGESESILNRSCLIILSYIAVYNTYAHVSSADISNVGMSFGMFVSNQHLLLEIAIRKFVNNGNSLTVVTENTEISACQIL